MLTNEDIEKLAPKMGVKLGYVGFKDLLPGKLQPGKFYVINLEDHQDQESLEMNDGSHWTCFYCRSYKNGRGNEAVYFDSYGVEPPEELKKQMKRDFECNPYVVKKNVQSLVSDSCGWYCMALGHFLFRDEFITNTLRQQVDNFLSLFLNLDENHDYHHNEYMLKQFFKTPEQEDIPLSKNVVRLKK